MKAFAHVLAICVGGFFIWTSVGKIADPVEFYRSILNYQLLGERMAWWVALFLPWLEVFAGLGVMPPFTRKGGLFWLVAMLTVFITALLSALARGLNIDCGCTGGAGSSVTFALVRNCFLLAALTGVYLLDIKSHKKIS
ncbi:MauE/DoxX family redox-associated membrane protein [Cerasicoccus frondis]|uniref:MauE/DoxX family redox-associated membrane protein n=1 Tax=Cerasicoccus frondis TaxID=490090 RepID=UPI0028526DBA|nr:MauE/DoxX family redox-associated membrane protein [Cerasicoccus frondis]